MISDKYKNLITKYIMTSIIIIMTIMRKPQLLYHPRFYAEEGQSFFAAAYNNTLLHYISSPMYGYYALYNVIATSFATIFPLEIAPLITTCQALIIQVATSIFVIWCDIPILNSNTKRFLVAISFPLLCPGQIWLTTIGVQYWLCIMTALILLEGPAVNTKPAHAVKAMVLILTGLTGVLSCIMTPFFMLKWIENKSKQFIVYTCILGTCSIIQIITFAQAYLKHDIGLSNRFVMAKNTADLMYTATLVFLGSFIVPKESIFFPIADNLDTIIKQDVFALLSRYGFSYEEAIFFAASIIIILVIVPIASKYILNIDYMIMIMSSIIVFWLSIKLSINSSGGPRYAFAPSAMLMLFLIASYSKNTLSAAHRIFLSTVIAVIIIIHFNDYLPSMDRNYNDKWPKWEEEVRLWRSDKDHPLKIWPPPWQMILNKQNKNN